MGSIGTASEAFIFKNIIGIKFRISWESLLQYQFTDFH